MTPCRAGGKSLSLLHLQDRATRQICRGSLLLSEGLYPIRPRAYAHTTADRAVPSFAAALALPAAASPARKAAALSPTAVVLRQPVTGVEGE